MGEMLFDELTRMAARQGETPRFNGASVFDLGGIIDIVESWQDMWSSKVPKRPPGDKVFCEWDCEHVDWDGTRLRIGALITNCDQVEWMVKPESKESVGFIGHKNIGHGTEFEIKHAFFVHMFRKIIRAKKNNESAKYFGVPYLSEESFVVTMNEDCTELNMSGSVVGRTVINFIQMSIGTIGYKSEDVIGCSVHNFNNIQNNPGVAFVAFSLLNCRNVVTETIKGPLRPRKFIERNYPPYCSYKVLKVQVPAKYVASQQEDDLSDDDKEKNHVRLHVCRGHFKQMRSPRFKRQGEWYWVPQHLRGTKELGTIVKDYKLVDSSTNAKG